MDTEEAGHEAEEIKEEIEADHSEGQGQHEPEEGPSEEEKGEEEEEMDTGTDGQDKDTAEHPEENSEDEQQSLEDKDEEASKGSAENGIPVDQGLQPQVLCSVWLVSSKNNSKEVTIFRSESFRILLYHQVALLSSFKFLFKTLSG